MPAVTRWYVKTSFVYLVAGLLLGALLVAVPALGLPTEITALSPLFFHFLMVGWVTQLIFGVVYWMFPKVSRENPRGNPRLAWGTYLSLNAGLVLRAVGEPFATLTGSDGWALILVVSATLQWVAGMAFVASAWARVKER